MATYVTKLKFNGDMATIEIPKRFLEKMNVYPFTEVNVVQQGQRIMIYRKYGEYPEEESYLLRTE